jgi:pimeloyl-ACP methyl ester carboxylesterase
MDHSFSKFSNTDREEFLSDLSNISGCPVDEIEHVKFSSGCVIFDGELDREAVERLIEYFEKKNALVDDVPSQIKDFVEFCEKWSVSSLHSYLRVKLEEKEKKSEKQKDTVVFIHGWRGDEDSFGKMPSYVSEITECQAAIYSYPSDIWEKSPSIDMIARNFDNWVRNNVSSNRIAIVAHSMGGLVARRFVSLQFERSDRIDSLVRLFVFIASPHNGAVLANIGRHVPTFRKVQLNELSTDSSFLFSLNADWNKWVSSDYSKKSTIRCIVGANDKVVSINSAIGLDPNPIPLLGAGHIDIVKPKDENDEVVITTSRLLQESGFEAKNASS